MNTEQTFYREHKNFPVWITATKPWIFDPQLRRYKEPEQWAVAFNLHAPPKMIDGEYLKDGRKGKWFQTAQEAADAAFQIACEKIDASESNAPTN